MKKTLFTLVQTTKARSSKLLLCLLFFALVAAMPNANATHLVGGEITYKCISGNTYEVTLVLFRDCDGVRLYSSQRIFSSCGGSFDVRRVSIEDVTPLCPGEGSTCNGGSIPGIEKHTYTGTVNLPFCGSLILSYSSCCRNADITTLLGSNSLYISSLLETNLAVCNSSPVFNNNGSSYGCMGEVVNYNHGVTDPDGDQLVFSLVDCLQSASSTVTYAPGYSGLNPLSTTGGVSIDPATGAISFTPDIVQVGVLCVLVEEYRNGVKIGEITRDIQFNIENCNAGGGGNNPPVASGPYQYNVNPGSQLCFNIVGSDPNAGDLIKMTTNNGISGGTFMPALPQGFTASPSTQFCWTPTNADQNATHFFTITVQDDACPTVGQNTFTYQVVVGNACNLDIQCPTDIAVDSDANACGTNVSFSAPTISSGCPDATYECTIPGGGSCADNALDLDLTFDNYPEETSWVILDSGGSVVASGGTYGSAADGSSLHVPISLPDGNYTFIIEDRAGDGMCCSYGMGSYTLSSNGSTIASGGSFSYTESTDFCIASGGGSTVVNSGDFFPVGTTTVTCTATEGTQSASCTFDVVVTDRTPPMIDTDCPGTITLCGAQNVAWTPPSAMDNCGITNVSSNYSPGDYFSVGTHTVTYTFYDAAGLSVSCSFDVIIHPLPDFDLSDSSVPAFCQGLAILSPRIYNEADLAQPLTYSWSNGGTNLQTIAIVNNTTYTLTITDANGCSDSRSFYLSVTPENLLSAHTIVAGRELQLSESLVFGGGVGVFNATEDVNVHNNSHIYSFLKSLVVDIDGSSTVANYIASNSSFTLPAFSNNTYNDMNDIVVGAGMSMTLSGNHYGKITVEAGGTLTFANSNVYVKSLFTYAGATISFMQNTNLMLRAGMTLSFDNNFNPDWKDVIVYLNGQLNVREGSTVVSDIYALEGLEVNEPGSTETTYMYGLFISDDGVESGDNVEWGWHIGCGGISIPATLSAQIDNGPANTAAQPILIQPTPKVKERALTIYPNPASNNINVVLDEFTGRNVQITLTNGVGKVVWHKTITDLQENTVQIDAQDPQFTSGLYYISVQSDNKVKTKIIALVK